MQLIIIIAAVCLSRIIGINGKIPWRLKHDMQRFKELTTGNICIMGAETWQSLPKAYKPLENRINIVLTSDPSKYNFTDFGVELSNSTRLFTLPNLETALKLAKLGSYGKKNIYLCGGERVYKEGWALADRLEITYVSTTVVPGPNDKVAYFPEQIVPLYPQFYKAENSEWLISNVKNNYDADKNLGYQFYTYDRP